jgi:pilus assembly protein Flp/PilA
MKRLRRRLLGDESGATAIEYGLIGALLSIAIIVGVTALGTSLQGIYAGISNVLP